MPARAPVQQRRAVSANCSANGNGTRHWSNGNGSGHTQELFVADLDMTMDDLDESYADRPATTMRVPLPTHVQFSERRADGSSSAENVQLVRSNEALKAELATVKDELAVTQQEKQALQLQMVEKERALQATKADLIETRLELQRTESRLDDVNARLATASSERGEYRHYLMEAQKELQNTRTELLEWSEGLSELKEVMEGLDGDLSDLFGDSEYASVVSEALAAARSLPDGPTGKGAEAVDADTECFASALEDLHRLSAEVLKQAEEDRRLFGM